MRYLPSVSGSKNVEGKAESINIFIHISFALSKSYFSAGIGRTGTFIALDALYSHGTKTGKINIPEYVKTLRKDRMSMIQSHVRVYI